MEMAQLSHEICIATRPSARVDRGSNVAVTEAAVARVVPIASKDG